MKEKLIIFLLATICILSGCQKTPETVITNKPSENNIGGIFGDENITEDGTTESLENMTVVNITTTEIDEKIQIGDKTITFKGTISTPDRTDGLYTYRGIETDYDEYFNKMQFLFGEYEEHVHVDEHVENMKTTGRIRMEDCEYTAQISNSRADTVDRSQLMSAPMAVTFYGNWSPYIKDDELRWVSEDELKVHMTNEEAKKKADEIISTIGVKGFEYEKCEYRPYPVAEGYVPLLDSLAVLYRQHLQGVPVIFYYGENTRCGINISFVSKGVECVQIVEYNFERVERNSQCLNYDEALECLKKYVDSSPYFDGAIFTDISFEYIIQEEYVGGKKVCTVIPCYKFEVDYTQRYPDLYVDARNGKVYSQYEYYE